MTNEKKRVLRPLGAAELSAVRGGGMLIPAVQKIRDASGRLEAINSYLKIGDVSGEPIEP